MNKVLVLLSYYHGSKYIQEQIHSILNQKEVDVHINIRIDHKIGDEEEIFDSYLNDKRFTIYDGNNVGFARSFINLIKEAPETYDYIAFSDQDDIWLEDKLITGIKEMRDNQAGLYFSNFIVADRYGNKISEDRTKHDLTMSRLIYANVAGGCTYIMNHTYFKKLKADLNLIDESKITFHDWFVSIHAYLCDKIFYAIEGRILYRQHGENSVGFNEKKRDKNFKFTALSDRYLLMNEIDKVAHHKKIRFYLKTKKNIIYRFFYAIFVRTHEKNLKKNIRYRKNIILNKH